MSTSKGRVNRGPRAVVAQAPNDLTRGRTRGRSSNSSNRAQGGQQKSRASTSTRSSTNPRTGSSSSRTSRSQNEFSSAPQRLDNGDVEMQSFQPPQSKPADLNQYYALLKRNREAERAHAVANNLVDDPNVQRRLEDAITFVGTCQDMCPEFERVERIVRRAVDACEKIAGPDGIEAVSQEHMVKRFRRSAAGDEAQLPSDVRPPLILKKTLHYLIDEVVGGRHPLAKVHAFVWDRTRSIRNDFTLQNIEGFKNDDLLLAIYCYELIARFHIHALHELSNPDIDDQGFTAHNEREQLNKTLLSLMEFYDLGASRGLKCDNEAEFRAYMILMHIYNQDVEGKAMDLGRRRPELFAHPRFQLALELYAAAGNTHDLHGPLRPPSSIRVAQNNFAKFFRLVRSGRVSYTMACMAEIHFNQIRKDALVAIRAGYRTRATAENATLQLLVDVLGFDTEQEAQAFSEACGINVTTGNDGLTYLMLNTAPTHLADPNATLKQPFSETLAEHKRHGRTLPQVIHGLTVQQARATVNGEQSEPATTSAASKPSLSSAPLGPSGSGFSNGLGSFGKPTSTLNPFAEAFSPSAVPRPEASKEPQQFPFTQPGLFGSGTSSRLGSFGKPSSLFASSGNQSSLSVPAPQETSESLGGFGKPSSMLIPGGNQSSPFNQAPEEASSDLGKAGEASSKSILVDNEHTTNNEVPKSTSPSTEPQSLRSCLKSVSDGSPPPTDQSSNESPPKKKAVHFKEGREESLFVTGYSDEEEESSGQAQKTGTSLASSSSESTGGTGQTSILTSTSASISQPSSTAVSAADMSSQAPWPSSAPGKTTILPSPSEDPIVPAAVPPPPFTLPSSKGSNEPSLLNTSTVSGAMTPSLFQLPEKASHETALSQVSAASDAAAPPSSSKLPPTTTSMFERVTEVSATKQATSLHPSSSLHSKFPSPSTFDFLLPKTQPPASTKTTPFTFTPSGTNVVPTTTNMTTSTSEVTKEASASSSSTTSALRPSDTAVLSTSNSASSLPAPSPSVADESDSIPQHASSTPPDVAQVQSESTADTVSASQASEPTPAHPGEIPEDMISYLLSDEGGLMDQLIDFVLPDVVKSAEQEHDEEVVKEYRQCKLMEKYIRRWRRNAEKLVTIRLGKRKRERMNQYLKESKERKKRKSDPEVDRLLQTYRAKYSLGEFNTSQPRSSDGGRPSAIHAEIDRRLKRKSDSDLESMIDNARAKRRLFDTRMPMPRITSSIAQISSQSLSGSGENLDTSRYAPMNASIRKDPRLASLPGVYLFTGKAIMDSPLALAATNGMVRRYGVGDATKSDFWRLKAAGLESLPNGVVQPIDMPPSAPKMTKKRSLETDQNEDTVEERASKSQKRSIHSSTSASESIPTTNGTSHTPPSTSTGSSKEAEKTKGEDLHTKVQKLLAKMDEGIEWYREEIAKEKQRQEQSQASMKMSNGSVDSSGRHLHRSGSSSSFSSIGAGKRKETTTPSRTAGRWWSRNGGIDLSLGPKLGRIPGMGSGSVGSGIGVNKSSPLKPKPTPTSMFKSSMLSNTTRTTPSRIASTLGRQREEFKKLFGSDRK